MASQRRRLVSLGELAHEWACSRDTVRRTLVAEGIEPYRLGSTPSAPNACLRFDRAEVDAVLSRRRGKNTSPEST